VTIRERIYTVTKYGLRTAEAVDWVYCRLRWDFSEPPKGKLRKIKKECGQKRNFGNRDSSNNKS
jgi:hypothetical protein